MRNPASKAIFLTLAAALASASPVGAAENEAATRISRPGEYSGYSPVLFDGYKLESVYVTVRDGTKLAIDIIRPTKNGVVATEKLPVVWMHTPYNRRNFKDGFTPQYYPGSAMGLVKYGYVIAMADVRGLNASFGRAVNSRKNYWIPWAYWDAYDITEWLAAQPFSSGRIGMWGCSATGHSQFQAAATRPPHLKAIFPLSAPGDYYGWGGVVSPIDAAPSGEALVRANSARDKDAAPVDADTDGSLLAAAKKGHLQNIEPGLMPYRDSVAPGMKANGMGDYRYWEEVNTHPRFDEISKSGIAIYQSSNHDEEIRNRVDIWIKQRNLSNPMKTIYAPGKHCEWNTEWTPSKENPFEIVTEELRWFDHWLKGVPNGIMSEPPIYYYTYNQPADRAWQFAWQWPLPTAHNTPFYFGGRTTDAPAGGVNSGSLSPLRGEHAQGSDRYTVDYTVLPADLDQRGLAYTSAPMEADTNFVGHPVMHIWLSSSVNDADISAVLADVAPDGKVTLLPGTADGRLRASHRTLNEAPWDNLGLPFHRSYAADVKPLEPGKPVKLEFDMAPVSWTLRKGHRLRVLIAATGFSRRDEPPLTPRYDPAPTVELFHGGVLASWIDMPVERPVEAKVALTADGSEYLATVAFPASLDQRYIDDVDMTSIRVNGEAPRAAAVKGKRIEIRVDGARFAAGETLLVSGRFGATWDYGARMIFRGSARIGAR